MNRPDLAPVAWVVADLLHGTRDDQLTWLTPCPDYTVEVLLTHVHGLAQAFTAAAAKERGDLVETAPQPGAQRLPDNWRCSGANYLDALGLAWREPAAWTGMTMAGGVQLPGEVAGLVALDELVVHGWDLARATGQPFEPDRDAVAVVHTFLAESRADGAPSPIFGPVVEVSSDAPLLDRVIGLSGRDPSWRVMSSAG